jgi:hypothetical protein
MGKQTIIYGIRATLSWISASTCGVSDLPLTSPGSPATPRPEREQPHPARAFSADGKH